MLEEETFMTPPYKGSGRLIIIDDIRDYKKLKARTIK
jgi:hypothetical protein